MSSYVIAGASRGLGYAFLKPLSANPSNTVIGLVRNPGPTISQVQSDNLTNVHIVQADLTSYTSLQAAATQVSALTSGQLDYLINNGAYISPIQDKFLSDFDDSYDTLLSDMRNSFETNTLGVMNAINAFLPLIQKGAAKKIITISSGHADTELMRRYEVWESAPYAISKAAVNALVAKYDARYGKSEGILFLSLSPGVVDTGDISKSRSQLSPCILAVDSVFDRQRDWG